MTLVLSCTMSEPQTATVTVKYEDDYYSRSGSETFTMGALHDTGIGLDTLWLRPDAPGTWKFSVNDLTRGLHRPADILQFRFFLADAASDRKTGSVLFQEKSCEALPCRICWMKTSSWNSTNPGSPARYTRSLFRWT